MHFIRSINEYLYFDDMTFSDDLTSQILFYILFISIASPERSKRKKKGKAKSWNSLCNRCKPTIPSVSSFFYRYMLEHIVTRGGSLYCVSDTDTITINEYFDTINDIKICISYAFRIVFILFINTAFRPEIHFWLEIFLTLKTTNIEISTKSTKISTKIISEP